MTLASRVWGRTERWAEHGRGHRLRLRSSGHVAPDLRAGAGVALPVGAQFNAGPEGYVGTDVHFEISPSASVSLGRNVWISRGGHVVATRQIDIGDDVMIGEFTSLRDTTHSHRRTGTPMKRQPDVAGCLVIESDVWIGRGCLVQSSGETVVVGTGAVVAAHSVVTVSIPSFQIWGGTPARFLRDRA